MKLYHTNRLASEGRTIQYNDLPDRLWATTGIKIPNLSKYQEFGKTRNIVQHFSAPEGEDLSKLTLDFIYCVIDPLINNCWDLYAVDYNEDSEPYVYFLPALLQQGILFNVSPESVTDREYFDINWPEDKSYRIEMTKRMDIAQNGTANF